MILLMGTNLYFPEQSFARISSGSCDSHGMKIITSQMQCERVAQFLYLSDTSAKIYGREGRPHGCVYASDNQLTWIDPTSASFASAACGSTQSRWSFDCLCLGRGNH